MSRPICWAKFSYSFAEGGTCLFIEGRSLAFADAGLFFFIPFFIEHELAFHMPDDEGKTQNDENNVFPV